MTLFLDTFVIDESQNDTFFTVLPITHLSIFPRRNQKTKFFKIITLRAIWAVNLFHGKKTALGFQSPGLLGYLDQEYRYHYYAKSD